MARDIGAQDLEAINQVMGLYVEGAIKGSSDIMRPAFHDGATVFGYVGEDLLAGPIELLFDWNDNNGPAKELETQIARVEISSSTASVRVELHNWTGNRFTDLFTLLKFDGDWKITHKAFHLHN